MTDVEDTNKPKQTVHAFDPTRKSTTSAATAIVDADPPQIEGSNFLISRLRLFVVLITIPCYQFLFLSRVIILTVLPLPAYDPSSCRLP
jgi:hypothetical protein